MNFRNTYIIALILSLLGANSSFASSIIKSIKNSVDFSILENHPQFIQVQYEFANFIKDEIVVHDRTLTSWHLDGFGQLSDPYTPIIPALTDTYLIPKSCTYTLSYECSPLETFDGFPNLNPEYAPMSVTNMKEVNKPESIIDSSIPISCLCRTSYDSDYDLVKVLILPVTYDNDELNFHTYSCIKYSVAIGDNTIQKLSSDITHSCISSDSIYKHNIIYDRNDQLQQLTPSYQNINLSKARVSNIKAQEAPADLYIVTVDKYLGIMEQYAFLKKSLGLNVTILSTPKWESSQCVKDSLVNKLQLNQHEKYLLIAGDLEDVPSFESTLFPWKDLLDSYNQGRHFTDYYYCTFDNQFDTPLIYQGRLTANSPQEMYDIIEKYWNYELCPETCNNHPTKNIILGAMYEEEKDNAGYERLRFIRTSEEVHDAFITLGYNPNRLYNAPSSKFPHYYSQIYSEGFEMPFEIQKPNYSWEYKAHDYVDALNHGSTIALYIGHGSTTGWGGLNFGVNNLQQVNKNYNTSLLLSMCCSTGEFSKNCLAEQFAHGYAGGAIGASFLAASWYTDVLTEGMLNSIWPQLNLRPYVSWKINQNALMPHESLTYGQILQHGLEFMDNYCITGNTNIYPLYQKEVYHLFGDPSMIFHTSCRETFKDAQVIRDENSIEVNTGNEEAIIAFYNTDNEEILRFVGTNVILSDLLYPKSYIVTISARNKKTLFNGWYDTTQTLINGHDLPELYIVSGNPFHVTLEYSDPLSEQDVLVIRDFYGKIISRTKPQINTAGYSEIKLDTFAKGLNYIYLERENERSNCIKIMR